jgi:hypothetical protein
MSERENLSAAEMADLSKAHCLAMDLYRKQSEEQALTPCCWLTMSVEAKSDAIDQLLEYLSKEMKTEVGINTLRILSNGVPDEMLHQWQEAEAVYKRLRAEGNPRAFFVG